MRLLKRLKKSAIWTPLRTLILTIFITLIIPVTFLAVSQRQELRKKAAVTEELAISNYVQTSGRNFVIDGQIWTHIGINSVCLAHYGTGGDWGCLEYATEEDQDTQLAAARDMGAKAIRIFAANENLTHVQSAARVKTLADKAYYNYGIRLLVSFTNFYDTPYNPQGDQVYYAIDLNGYTVLNHQFFTSGFRNNYLPWVKTLVQELKDHPGVFAWELGNELKDVTFSNSNSQTLVDFANEVVAEIRLIDTNHLITSGIISAQDAGLSADQARQLYENLSFINNHNYNEPNDFNNDLWLAVEQNKPHIIGEAGFPGNNRSSLVAADVNDWLTRGTQGYYQWGFMATDQDIGDGDKLWGMDKIFHNDWNSLFSIYGGNGGPTGTMAPTVTVVPTGTMAPTGTIVALPEKVIIPDSQTLGITTITWHVYGVPDGQVWVSQNGGAEKLFATGIEGTASASWISLGNWYDFRLYSATGFDLEDKADFLTNVIVVGTSPPICNSLSIKSSIVVGEQIDISADPGDDREIDKVSFHYTSIGSDYCNGDVWNLIGTDENPEGGWSVIWDTKGFTSGDYYIVANVWDIDGTWCTSNPGGSCGTTAFFCPNCQKVVNITPLCYQTTIENIDKTWMLWADNLSNTESAWITFDFYENDGTELFFLGDWTQPKNDSIEIGERSNVPILLAILNELDSDYDGYVVVQSHQDIDYPYHPDIIPDDPGLCIEVTAGPVDEVCQSSPEKIMPGDLNCDCKSNMIDIMEVVNIWNTEEGDDGFKPEFDFDNNGRISVADIMHISTRWNTNCSD